LRAIPEKVKKLTDKIAAKSHFEHLFLKSDVRMLLIKDKNTTKKDICILLEPSVRANYIRLAG